MSPRGGQRPGAGRKPSEVAARDHLHIRVSSERLAVYREAAARESAKREAAGKPEVSLSECVIEQLDAWAARR